MRNWLVRVRGLCCDNGNGFAEGALRRPVSRVVSHGHTLTAHLVELLNTQYGVYSIVPMANMIRIAVTTLKISSRKCRINIWWVAHLTLSTRRKSACLEILHVVRQN